MFAGARLSGRLVILGVLALIAVTIPASAQTEPQDSTTLSVSDRLDERRYVTTGDRAYVVGTEAGRFPAMGFHTRGEMGGIWSPPIKLGGRAWEVVISTRSTLIGVEEVSDRFTESITHL